VCEDAAVSGFAVLALETVEYHGLPGRYFLIARDAFNGMKLWERPLQGIWPTRGYLKFIATQIQRRIAAVGDGVYCLQGNHGAIDYRNMVLRPVVK
jgi:hypothetical protein